LNLQEYDEGNTLLHLLCAKGDSHVYVLAELLSMKDRNNAPYFDINQHNHREGRNVVIISYFTPLSVDKTDSTLGFHSMDCNLSFTVLAAVSLTVQISNVTVCRRASSSDVSKSLCSCCLTIKVKETTCFKISGNICPTTHCHISEDFNLQGMQ